MAFVSEMKLGVAHQYPTLLESGLTAPNPRVNRVIGDPLSGGGLGPWLGRRRGEGTGRDQGDGEEGCEVHF